MESLERMGKPSSAVSGVEKQQRPTDPGVILTIGYPTYNRASAIEAAVSVALRHVEHLPIEVLVADNASEDGTVRRLATRYRGSNLRLVAGTQNLGWQGNVTRLVENASGNFLLLVSDEDDIADALVLRELIDYLVMKPELSLLTTGGTSTSNHRSRIDAKHLWKATNYISGTIFSVCQVRAWLSRVDEIRLTRDIDELWELYPHYMLAVGIWVTGGECNHFARDVHNRARELPMRWVPRFRLAGDAELRRTGSEHLGKAHLRSISSNILQHANLAAFIGALEESMQTEASRLHDIRAWQADRVARRVDDLISAHYPELYPYWQHGFRRRYSCKRTNLKFFPRISRWGV